jgi:hypothetical protein
MTAVSGLAEFWCWTVPGLLRLLDWCESGLFSVVQLVVDVVVRCLGIGSDGEFAD